MASPQVENGYAPIANELLDALLRSAFTGTQWAILLWVVRNTYGFSRKTTRFSWMKIAEDIGRDHGGITREGNRLLGWNVLKQVDGQRGLQKDYEQWKIGKKALSSVSMDTEPTQSSRVTHTEPAQQNTEPAQQNTEPAQSAYKVLNQKSKIKQAGRFAPPTPAQIDSYCHEKGININPMEFYAYYESNGWMVGKNKMKKWKAAAYRWFMQQERFNGRKQESKYI